MAHNTIIRLCQYFLFHLISNRNNLHLKTLLLGWNTRAEMDIGNNIEYDVKSYQAKITIVNCTNIRLEVLKMLTAHRRICWYSWHVSDANNIILRRTWLNKSPSGGRDLNGSKLAPYKTNYTVGCAVKRNIKNWSQN